MENCLNGEFHSRNYINLMKMKQPPIFVFKCVINASIEYFSLKFALYFNEFL